MKRLIILFFVMPFRIPVISKETIVKKRESESVEKLNTFFLILATEN